MSNRQGRGALSKHIKQGLQNQDDTPVVDLRCSVLFIDSDGRPVLCPGIITDVFDVSSAQYKIAVDFDHKETLTLVYPCPERRIFLHKKTWQATTLLAEHNNRIVRVSLSFMKSPPSKSSTISQVPSGRPLTVSTASIQLPTSSSTTQPLSDKELDAIVPTIPPMIMPDGCVVRQAIRHGRVLTVSISYSELTSSDHPSIDTPSTTYDIDRDDNSTSSTTSSSALSNKVHLHGSLHVDGETSVFTGYWSYGEEEGSFSYEKSDSSLSLEPCDMSGDYFGSFSFGDASVYDQFHLYFTSNEDEDGFDIKGMGTNELGGFVVKGTYRDGIVDLFREYKHSHTDKEDLYTQQLKKGLITTTELDEEYREAMMWFDNLRQQANKSSCKCYVYDLNVDHFAWICNAVY